MMPCDKVTEDSGWPYGILLISLRCPKRADYRVIHTSGASLIGLVIFETANLADVFLELQTILA
jgi:hypothetical protein